MDLKTVDRKRTNQAKDIYVEGSVLNYATKAKNDPVKQMFLVLFHVNGHSGLTIVQRVRQIALKA